MKNLERVTVIVFVAVLAVFIGLKAYTRMAVDTTPPQISCDTDTIDISVADPESVLLQGVTAKDDRDGDLTGSIMVKGVTNLLSGNTARVSYIVFDSSNNMATCQRTIRYTDYEKHRFALSQPLIYHEGGIYRVIKVKLSANALNHVAADGHLMKTKGYICSHCGCGMFNDDKASEPPMYSVCPICRQPIDFKNALVQELYGIETVEAYEASRITVMDEERQRMGFDVQTTFSLAKDAAVSRREAKIATEDGVTTLTYVPAATIWRINKGLRRRANKNELGYYINSNAC